MIARVFAGLLLREFGEDAFGIERVDQTTERILTTQAAEAVA